MVICVLYSAAWGDEIVCHTFDLMTNENKSIYRTMVRRWCRRAGLIDTSSLHAAHLIIFYIKLCYFRFLTNSVGPDKQWHFATNISYNLYPQYCFFLMKEDEFYNTSYMLKSLGIFLLCLFATYREYHNIAWTHTFIIPFHYFVTTEKFMR